MSEGSLQSWWSISICPIQIDILVVHSIFRHNQVSDCWVYTALYLYYIPSSCLVLLDIYIYTDISITHCLTPYHWWLYYLNPIFIGICCISTVYPHYWNHYCLWIFTDMCPGQKMDYKLLDDGHQSIFIGIFWYPL